MIIGAVIAVGSLCLHNDNLRKLSMSHERTVRIRDKFATDPVDPLEFDFRHIFPPKIVRQIMCNPGGKIVVYAHFQA